jgi:hypothetical protein
MLGMLGLHDFVDSAVVGLDFAFRGPVSPIRSLERLFARMVTLSCWNANPRMRPRIEPNSPDAFLGIGV